MRNGRSQKTDSEGTGEPQVRFLCTCSGIEQSEITEVSLSRAGSQLIKDLNGQLTSLEIRLSRQRDSDYVECAIDARLTSGRVIRLRETARTPDQCTNKALQALRARVSGENRDSKRSWGLFSRRNTHTQPSSDIELGVG